MPDTTSSTTLQPGNTPGIDLSHEQNSGGYVGLLVVATLVLTAVVFLSRRWLRRGASGGACAGCSSGACPMSDPDGRMACDPERYNFLK